jgi:hypothetical protein
MREPTELGPTDSNSASIQGRSSSAKAVSRVWWFWFSTPQCARTTYSHCSAVSSSGARLETKKRTSFSTSAPSRRFTDSTRRKVLAWRHTDSSGPLPSP